MKKISLILMSLVLCVFVACNKEEPVKDDNDGSAQAGKNLVAAWDGQGKVSPDAAGWKSTSAIIPWAIADATGGCRYRTPNGSLPDDFIYEDGTKFNAVEFMLRFDNNSYEGAVYGFESSEALIAGKTYKVSFDYHIGNGGNKNLKVAMATSMDFITSEGTSQDGKNSKIEIHTLTTAFSEQIFETNQDKMTWRKASFTFTAEKSEKHFVTFKGDRDWFGLSNLKLEIIL